MGGFVWCIYVRGSVCLPACWGGGGGGGCVCYVSLRGGGSVWCLYILCVCVCAVWEEGGAWCIFYCPFIIVFSVDLLLLLFFLAFYSVLSDVSVACADPGMHHEDKKKIKQLIYHQVRDFLFYPRAELSDDEDGESFFRLLAASRCVSCLCVS